MTKRLKKKEEISFSFITKTINIQFFFQNQYVIISTNKDTHKNEISFCPLRSPRNWAYWYDWINVGWTQKSFPETLFGKILKKVLGFEKSFDQGKSWNWFGGGHIWKKLKIGLSNFEKSSVKIKNIFLIKKWWVASGHSTVATNCQTFFFKKKNVVFFFFLGIVGGFWEEFCSVFWKMLVVKTTSENPFGKLVLRRVSGVWKPNRVFKQFTKHSHVILKILPMRQTGSSFSH